MTVHDPPVSATESGWNSLAPGRAARHDPAVTVGKKTSFQAPERCQQTQEPGALAGCCSAAFAVAVPDALKPAVTPFARRYSSGMWQTGETLEHGLLRLVPLPASAGEKIVGPLGDDDHDHGHHGVCRQTG